MNNTKTKKLVVAALMTAIIAITAQISIPIGAVPLSLGVLGVLLAGLLLPPTLCAASLATYVLIGAIGLPVFAGFKGGPDVLVGPTGGYILGYFLLALIPALIVKYKLPIWCEFAGAGLGLLLDYLLGTFWFMFVTENTFIASLGFCVTPFVIPDIAKIIAAVLLARAIRKRMSAQLSFE